MGQVSQTAFLLWQWQGQRAALTNHMACQQTQCGARRQVQLTICHDRTKAGT